MFFLKRINLFTMKNKNFNFFIVVGVILILTRLIDYNKEWSIVAFLKVLIGIILIIYGIVKNKKTKN